MNYPSATAATASHPTLARTIKRLRSVGEGRGARDLFPPASRPCCSTPSVTTSPYSTTVFQVLREPLRCRALILLSSKAARRVRVAKIGCKFHLREPRRSCDGSLVYRNHAGQGWFYSRSRPQLSRPIPRWPHGRLAPIRRVLPTLSFLARCPSLGCMRSGYLSLNRIYAGDDPPSNRGGNRAPDQEEVRRRGETRR